jgi:ATP-binding cassette, subfamily C (CFTR/MRP), member 4
MRYRPETDHVLKGLSFKIEAGEKVGCVGRTGAGKSSIIQALFRMTPIDHSVSHCNIFIDSENIESLGLHTLRRNISIIPQTPFVFSGTIRRNLDPFNEYSTADIWKALEDVDLKDYIQTFGNLIRVAKG